MKTFREFLLEYGMGSLKSGDSAGTVDFKTPKEYLKFDLGTVKGLNDAFSSFTTKLNGAFSQVSNENNFFGEESNGYKFNLKLVSDAKKAAGALGEFARKAGFKVKVNGKVTPFFLKESDLSPNNTVLLVKA